MSLSRQRFPFSSLDPPVDRIHNDEWQPTSACCPFYRHRVVNSGEIIFSTERRAQPASQKDVKVTESCSLLDPKAAESSSVVADSFSPHLSTRGKWGWKMKRVSGCAIRSRSSF
ncbi:hypothetical protein TNIN_64141 [Trichonephila inaurata madagascariensis]|uniref:Uncharacterized protein n=1 Tax=Trichonephila inaurata madagascariensis TaxID=2747483 RepID=A0A8X6JPR0_9ARAC|nr:hypothetical protein TNIN_64141 [Trichonephila inaurata madagascariensis]